MSRKTNALPMEPGQEHWSRFIYNAGRGILYRADDQEKKVKRLLDMQRQIDELQKQIKGLRADYDRDEVEILDYVTSGDDGFTPEEVQQAKERGNQFKTRQAYYDHADRQYSR